jgi:hypothetical protein
MHAVFLGKALHNVILVFPHSAHEVVGDADVECAITFAGENVDVVLTHCAVHHVNWILARAGMTSVCHAREGGHPVVALWIPACAGMTFSRPTSCQCGRVGLFPRLVSIRSDLT